MDALHARGVAVFGYVAGEQPNARGAEALGMLPRDGGLDSGAMIAAALDGKLRALGLFGVNPVLHHPLGERAVRDAFERIGFIVATELFLTETAALAHLVLPARGAFEKSGHTYDLAGDPIAIAAAHAPPEGTLSDGEMFVALASELAIDVPTPDALHAAASAPVPASAQHFADSASAGAETPRAAEPAGGLRLALASHIFAGGGTSYFDDSIRALRPEPSATIAPATAAANGLRAGDRVRLVAGERELRDLLVVVDEHAVPDVVVAVDGLPSAPANGFADGEPVRLEALVITGAV
jgi:anaerobic selenocysteine-containing dehydrogenase